MARLYEDINVKQVLLDILKMYECNSEHVIQMEDTLSEDLGLDSLDMIEVIMDIEDAFDYNIEIYDEEQEHIQTVEDLFNLVLNKFEEVKHLYGR